MHLPRPSTVMVACLFGLALAACGSGAAAPTPEASPTAALVPTSTSAPPTEIPTALPPTPTATATPVPTPRVISAADPSTFQVIRHTFLEAAPDETFVGSVSPDGKLAVVGGCDLDPVEGYCFDRTVLRLFDVDTGRTLRDLDVLAPVMQRLAFSPDSSLLAVAGCTMPLYLVGEPDTNCLTPRLWISDLSTGEVRHDLDSFESDITSLVFSPDGSRLYVGVNYSTQWDETDNEIRVYDTASGERMGWIETAVGNCTSAYLEVSSDGRFLVMDGRARCSWPSLVRWWDVTDPGNPIDIHREDYVSWSILSPDGTRLLAKNPNNGSLMLFDVQTGEQTGFYPRVSDSEPLELLSNTDLLIRVDRHLAVLDLTSGDVIQEIEPAGYQFYADYALTPDRSTLITFASPESLGAVPSVAHLWRTDTWESSETLPFAHALEGVDSPLAQFAGFSADQTRYVILGLFGFEVTVLGSPAPEIAQAQQALQGYLDALASGDYDSAATLLRVAEPDLSSPLDMPYVPDIEGLLPGADRSDPASMLEAMCAIPEYACLPVRDVTYSSQVNATGFSFLVTFAGEDGEVALRPLCWGNPDPTTCQHFDGLYAFYVERQRDGAYRVVNGFPPGLEALEQEAFSGS